MPILVHPSGPAAHRVGDPLSGATAMPGEAGNGAHHPANQTPAPGAAWGPLRT
jgi:hypothetical protein